MNSERRFQMRAKVLSTDHTVYPLDYDKNGKAGLVEWRQHVHDELHRTITPVESTLLEAKQILVRDARYKTPEYSRNVKGDRIVYALLIVLGIALGLSITLLK